MKTLEKLENELTIAIIIFMFIGGIIGYNIGVKLTIERAKVVSVDSIGCEIEYDNGQIHRYNI